MGNAESSYESDNKFSSAVMVAAAVAGGVFLWALRALGSGSQSQKLEPHGRRHESNSSPVTTRERKNICISRTEIKIMSYNVWANEDVEVEERIKAIGDLVQERSPDIIFFQEVTPYIYELFHSSRWWRLYNSSVSPEEAEKGNYFCMLLSKPRVTRFMSMPFKNSSKEKGLVGAEIEICSNKTVVVLTVATSHLQSPNPPKMNNERRVSQAKEALLFLQKFPNVIFGGDMNWDENIDGDFPLQRVWKDAWKELREGEHGWTFDTKSNVMLHGHYRLQKRLDRFICKLEDCSMKDIEMIGKKPIPGISYYNNQGKQLPVLPSDHYGLILTISINV